MWLATLGAFGTFGMLVLTLPQYVKDELGHGSVGVGAAMGAASVTAVITSPPAGRLSDRRGRRPLILAGALVMAACYLALALGPGLPGVVAVRLLAGAGEAAIVVGLYTVATDLAPEGRHGEAMSLITLASYLGLTVGPAFADFLLGGDRFALVWLVTAALVLASLAAVATLPDTRPRLHAAPGGWLPPHGAVLPGSLVLLGLLGFGGFTAFAALYAKELGIGRPGLLFALFGGVIALIRFFGRKLPDALGSRRTIQLSFVTLALGLATLGSWQTATGMIVGTVVFAVGQALMYPAAVLLAMESTSTAERSAAVGSVGAFVDVALGLGAVTLGGVAAISGYGGAFITASIVSLGGLLLVTSLSSRRLPLEEAAR